MYALEFKINGSYIYSGNDLSAFSDMKWFKILSSQYKHEGVQFVQTYHSVKNGLSYNDNMFCTLHLIYCSFIVKISIIMKDTFVLFVVYPFQISLNLLWFLWLLLPPRYGYLTVLALPKPVKSLLTAATNTLYHCLKLRFKWQLLMLNMVYWPLHSKAWLMFIW